MCVSIDCGLLPTQLKLQINDLKYFKGQTLAKSFISLYHLGVVIVLLCLALRH